MSTPNEAALNPGVSPLDAFGGTVTRPKTGVGYQLGLAIVALAMVLLPLMYLAVIACTGWGVVLHLTNDTWIVEGAHGRGGLYRLLLYLAPAVAGVILVFFMVKPFFAGRAKPVAPMTLDPAGEQLLFGFVKRICRLVGAPVPCRIDVDCQVNASASLRRGLWSKDLVLTIGLPLVSGLEMRQFAGVLAHEFGHFAQGAGMRLTYVIRQINFWFARVVYERDAWDVKLEEAAKNTDIRFGIVLYLAQGCIWLTRRLLWLLMRAGHGISCFMLRQMEYDADRYEAKLAGSDAFESTASRLRVLAVATQIAYEDVRQSWTSSRLPENLPLLIEDKARSLPGELQQKVSAASAAETTRWFHTHPSDADRVRAVQRLAEPGIFHLTEPATHLFVDFPALSKAVTRHHYEKQLELEFTEQNLMSSEEVLRESAASTEADAMARKFYGRVNVSLAPLLISGEFSPLCGDEAAPAWRAAREASESLRADAETVSDAYAEQERRCVTLCVAQHLSRAGFAIETKALGLPESAKSPGELEAAAQIALAEASTALAQHRTGLEPFFAALRERVTLALRYAMAENDASDPKAAGEWTGLAPLLAALGTEMPRVREIGMKLRAFTVLLQNVDQPSQPAALEKTLKALASELQSRVGQVQSRLKPFAYPFPHPRSPLTVAEYARSEKPAEHQWQRAYMDSDAHVDRLFALNYRLIARILAVANAAEARLEGRPGDTSR